MGHGQTFDDLAGSAGISGGNSHGVLGDVEDRDSDVAQPHISTEATGALRGDDAGFFELRGDQLDLVREAAPVNDLGGQRVVRLRQPGADRLREGFAAVPAGIVGSVGVDPAAAFPALVYRRGRIREPTTPEFAADNPFALRGELRQVSAGFDQVLVRLLAPDLFGVHSDRQKIEDSALRVQARRRPHGQGRLAAFPRGS